ncbi:MAG: hypothetical protein A2138_07275 [Deltaproteobacteria bacterium RBG_16_71_12]|nr:MAG: hypothetical protein A2138_07275 [Deltaproteobacteria bacterium RBG_16_71_12]
MTMAVTLRVLPRICRGRSSSAALGMVGLGGVVVALLLRAGELFAAGSSTVAVSALLTWLVVVVWALHLGHRLLPADTGRGA